MKPNSVTGVSGDIGMHNSAEGHGQETHSSIAAHVLLAEDEEMVRTLVATALRREGFLVSTACNGEEAIELVHSGIKVDVLLTDMQMGNGITGIVLAEHLLNERPGIAVLVMSGFTKTELLTKEKNLAFLAKPFTPDELVKRMRQVLTSKGSAHAGDRPALRNMKGNLVMMANRNNGTPEGIAMIGNRFRIERLTTRETEVLRLVADGYTTKEIASRLGITFKTAACHRYRIMSKLDVSNGALLVRRAIGEGLIQP